MVDPCQENVHWWAIHEKVDPTLLPRQYLFNLKIGEHRRATDMVTNGDDPSTREFIEHIVHAPGRTVTESVKARQIRSGVLTGNRV